MEDWQGFAAELTVEFCGSEVRPGEGCCCAVVVVGWVDAAEGEGGGVG